MEHDSYTIDYNSPLGEGSYGTVYTGSPSKEACSEVAVKVCALARNVCEGVLREVENLKRMERVKHANVVRFVDSSSDGINFYIVMEL